MKVAARLTTRPSISPPAFGVSPRLLNHDSHLDPKSKAVLTDVSSPAGVTRNEPSGDQARRRKKEGMFSSWNMWCLVELGCRHKSLCSSVPQI